MTKPPNDDHKDELDLPARGDPPADDPPPADAPPTDPAQALLAELAAADKRAKALGGSLFDVLNWASMAATGIDLRPPPADSLASVLGEPGSPVLESGAPRPFGPTNPATPPRQAGVRPN